MGNAGWSVTDSTMLLTPNVSLGKQSSAMSHPQSAGDRRYYHLLCSAGRTASPFVALVNKANDVWRQCASLSQAVPVLKYILAAVLVNRWLKLPQLNQLSNATSLEKDLLRAHCQLEVHFQQPMISKQPPGYRARNGVNNGTVRSSITSAGRSVTVKHYHERN